MTVGGSNGAEGGHDMKKRICLFLMPLALFVLLLSLSACGPRHVHTMSEWIGNPEATCTTGGFYTRACTGCSYSEERTVELLGHDMVTHPAKAPTCLEGGYDEYTACSRCNLPTHDTLPALGHDFLNYNEQTCARCPANRHLEFFSNGDGTCYLKKVQGDIDELVIPAYSEWGDKVVAIGAQAFRNSGWKTIETLILPEGIIKLENAAFSDARISQLILPSTLTTIGDRAFSDSLIQSIVIPKSVTHIGAEAFSGCKILKSITFEEGIQLPAIHAATFRFCEMLERLEIPSTVKLIEKEAFRGCATLVHLQLPQGVTTLSEEVFAGCKSLSVIELPSTVTVIEDQAFLGCLALTEFALPASLTEISPGLFSGCSSLASIRIPENVIEIGKSAFFGCTSLSEIVFEGNKVASIDHLAFDGCTALKSFTVPTSVTFIGGYCFQGAGCTEVVFENPEYWFVSRDLSQVPDAVTVSDPALAAEQLTGTFMPLFWLRLPPEGV